MVQIHSLIGVLITESPRMTQDDDTTSILAKMIVKVLLAAKLSSSNAAYYESEKWFIAIRPTRIPIHTE
jgi:hypothetical protein